ncbi:afadin- and alpha-actinin-binding protein-like [Arapaima gigas]
MSEFSLLLPPMSRLPKLSHKPQHLPPGLQDTFTLSAECGPPCTDASNSAFSWTGRPLNEERWPSRRSLDSAEQDLLLAEQEKDISRLQDALRRERENSQRLQSRCKQQAWELKCKEKQSIRLKERFSQLVDKNRDHKPMLCGWEHKNSPTTITLSFISSLAMELQNVLPRPLGKKASARGVRTEGRREEDVLRLMLERREAELREAITQGHSLTALLCSLRADMERTLQGCMGDADKGFDREMLLQSEALLGENVTGGVVRGWSKVQKKLQEFSQGLSPSTAGTDQEKLLAQLVEDLEQNKQLVRMQQQLLQDSIQLPLPTALTDSYYLEEWERLQMKWAEFEGQRQNFQRERQTFTDAAIRLGHEVRFLFRNVKNVPLLCPCANCMRVCLQRRRFEQQKALLLRQQFLCHSPFVQQRRESSAISVLSDHITISSHLPATPSSLESGIAPFSQQTHVQTPNTPELFSALRLSPGRRRSQDTSPCSRCWERSSPRVLDLPGDLDWSF